MLAKTIWGEARGCSPEEQELVVWCILNRVDNARWPDTIKGVVSQEDQFHGYCSDFPVEDDIKEVVLKVLMQWYQEEAPATYPPYATTTGYLFFSGDSKHEHNWYREEW